MKKLGVLPILASLHMGTAFSCNIAKSLQYSNSFSSAHREYVNSTAGRKPEQILAGELSLLKYHSPNDYDALMKTMDYSAWKRIIVDKNHAIQQSFDPNKNFAIQSITLLNKAAHQFDTYLPTKTRDAHFDFNETLHITSVEEDTYNTSHKILAGSFGVGAKGATSYQLNDIVGFLKNEVDRIYQAGNINEILRHYAVDNVTVQKTKNHLTGARILIASLFHYGNTFEREFTKSSLDAIATIVGEDALRGRSKDYIERYLKQKHIVTAFQSVGLIINNSEPVNPRVTQKIASEKILSDRAERQNTLYNQNPQKFYQDIGHDILTHTNPKKETGNSHSNRQYVENVVNFLMAVRSPNVHQAIRVKAEKNSWRSAPSYLPYELYLDATNTKKSQWEHYSLSLDTDSLKKAIIDEPYPIHSLIWLNEVLSTKEIEDARYNIATIRHRIASVWKMLFETLVYSYVFAKDHNLEKNYFSTAFPNEMHCTGSLATSLQSWMRRQIDIIQGNIDQSPGQKLNVELKTITRDLIDADNMFIGSIAKNLITKWSIQYLMPKFPPFNIKVDDAIAEPDRTLELFTNEAKQAAGRFAREATVLINTAAKDRAIGKWAQNAMYSGSISYYDGIPSELKTWHYYSTTDSDLVIFVKLQDNIDRYRTPKINPSDIKDVRVYVKINKNYSSAYVLLEDYLLEKYNAYFDDIAY